MKNNILSFLFVLLSSLGLHAQEKVNFSEAFKKENQGKYKVEINEVKELIQVMLAITKSGLENDDLVEQHGQYYKDVITHFKKYENEDIIMKFDSLLVASLYNYLFLTGNAITYDFKGKKLKPSKTFIFTATGVADVKIAQNPITTYKTDIENFAKKSDFRKFYKEHKTYYSGIVTEYNKKANLGKQWKWLEDNFSTKINSYVIYCSPLIGGLNYTGEFNNNNFRLIHMNLPSLNKHPELTEVESEVLDTRIMFTEIDHNYVNGPSNASKEIISQYFSNRKEWVNEDTYGTFAYPNPVDVFDEYMTYGVFLLYCKEHYDEAILKRTTQETINLMSERGFPKMKDFTDSLFKISAENPGKKIDEWYPEFLKLYKK